MSCEEVCSATMADDDVGASCVESEEGAGSLNSWCWSVVPYGDCVLSAS